MSNSLERLANESYPEIQLKELPQLERGLMRELNRAYPQSGDLAPPLDDDLGWLALMQHHGAPTRLLDWTYSPFVANELYHGTRY